MFFRKNACDFFPSFVSIIFVPPDYICHTCWFLSLSLSLLLLSRSRVCVHFYDCNLSDSLSYSLREWIESLFTLFLTPSHKSLLESEEKMKGKAKGRERERERERERGFDLVNCTSSSLDPCMHGLDLIVKWMK